MICQQEHRYDEMFDGLPEDQGGFGRHRCAGCAYERGLAHGLRRAEEIDIDLDTLPESQAGTVRHRSPHAAWAMGYSKGVYLSYNQS